MTLESIYQYFATVQPQHLNPTLAVCYVLSKLSQADSYGTALIQQLKQDYPDYRLSDTVLYKALKFLEQEAVIAAYWQNTAGRGRPRRMYTVCPPQRNRVESLTTLWQQHTGQLW